MNCPKCNSIMKSVIVEDQTVEQCSKCTGLWFDLREHERVAESNSNVNYLDSGDASVGAQQNQKRDIICPVCKVKMIKLAVPGQAHIQYESCPVCYGAFFDAGELKDFANVTIGEQVGRFFKGFARRAK